MSVKWSVQWRSPMTHRCVCSYMGVCVCVSSRVNGRILEGHKRQHHLDGDERKHHFVTTHTFDKIPQGTFRLTDQKDLKRWVILGIIWVPDWFTRSHPRITMTTESRIQTCIPMFQLQTPLSFMAPSPHGTRLGNATVPFQNNPSAPWGLSSRISQNHGGMTAGGPVGDSYSYLSSTEQQIQALHPWPPWHPWERLPLPDSGQNAPWWIMRSGALLSPWECHRP